jgi:hypothetical protein
MKKIRVNFTGSLEITANDFVLMNLETEKTESAAELLARGESIHGKDLIIESFVKTFQKALDEDFENLSWEIIEE